MRSLALSVITLGTFGFAIAPARAQCQQWSPDFHHPGTSGELNQLVVFDDGNGPSLFAAGKFIVAGETRANAIARFDGASWHAVGSGVGPFGPSTRILSMGVFDDGSGAQLYVSGDFTTSNSPWSHIARWDGSTWSNVGSGLDDDALHMLVFDDGSGAALYVTGAITNAGGTPVTGIARWNGSAWQNVDGGLTSGQFTGLAIYDDGGGPALYGTHTSPASGFVVQWDGSTWTTVGGGTNAVAGDPSVVDHGSGPFLYVTGQFTTAGGNLANKLARWDGSAWSAFPAPPPIAAVEDYDIWSYTDAGGSVLYVEAFESPGYDKRFERFDGTSWTVVTDDIGSNGEWGITDVVAFDDGSGNGIELYTGGRFTQIGGAAAPNIARYDGSTWSALAPAEGVTGTVYASVVFDDGSGRALYVGGEIYTAGDQVVRGIARRSASGWSGVGVGMSTSTGARGVVHALAVFDDGSGESLYAGGDFDTAGGPRPNIARWNGSSWVPVGVGLTGPCYALAVYDSGFGPELYAGGSFPAGGNIARWNGSFWQPLGTGTDANVYALEVFDPGTGAKLWVGGPFLTAGGLDAHKIATWSGAWASTNFSLTSGGEVRALEVFSGPSGVPTIYAAGSLNAGFMRWNGAGWTNVAPTGGLNVTYALRTFDDGSGNGPALYAAGTFAATMSIPYHSLAKWDGSAWTDVGGSFETVSSNGSARSLCPYDDDGDGRADLIVGGNFVATSQGASSSIAKWVGCTGPGTPYCFADGSLPTDCPCAAPNYVPIPSGSAFGGCANAFHPHGAGLSAIGAIDPDTVTLFAHGMSPAGYMMFFKASIAAPSGVAASDGVSCASSSGALIRFGAQNAVNGAAKYPNPPLGHTIPLSIRGATPVGSGLTGYYQAVYRHTVPSWCTPDTLNFTSSYRITWN